MNLADIKESTDKTAVDSLRGTVDKQYPPLTQTDNDLKWQQHRQSILLRDEDGTKLMITLMKAPMHILDAIEGQEIVLTAGTNDKGEKRGLVVNRWQKEGSQYPTIVVKVYPEATMRVLPPGGDPGVKATNSEEDKPIAIKAASHPPAHTSNPGGSAFDESIDLAARGFAICLDRVDELLEERPELQTPENHRVIATNLFLHAKHHLHTIGETEKPKASPKRKKESPEMDDAILIQRCMKGHAKLEEDENLSPKAQEVLADLDRLMDERGLWDAAYDELRSTANADDDAVNAVYDHHKEKMGDCVEKFFVGAPLYWREQVTEQAGRNG
tara:strand:+ start:5508 stop:6491 length:984 start_codon:yes stop_codon:yes gene_type:complete